MEIKKRIRIKMTFTEEILASLPSDKEIYNTYIASKLPPEQEFDIAELDAIDVDHEIEKGTTIFPVNEDEEACIYDYQIKGFFKGSCGLLREKGGKDPSSKLTAYKKKIDGKIFVFRDLFLCMCQMESTSKSVRDHLGRRRHRGRVQHWHHLRRRRLGRGLNLTSVC